MPTPKKTFRSLIIDDHEVTCRGYGVFFENAMNNGTIPKFQIDFAYSSEEAYNILLRQGKPIHEYDIVFLDIQLPPFPEHKIFTGEDLGIMLRKKNPEIKIIVQTSLSNNHALYNIFYTLNPDGILVKTDLDEDSFVACIKSVLDGSPFYSRTFSKLLRNQFTKGYILDQEEREFVRLLYQGIPSKDIPNHLPWSPSKVEKKKRILRQKFDVEDKNTFSLLSAIREAGFL